MSSNSRLNVLQKGARKHMLSILTDAMGAVIASEDERVTIAFMPEFEGSRMLRVAVSVASPDEIKIRRKVGEYHALDKLFDSEFIRVPDGTNMYALAQVISGMDIIWIY